MRIALAQLNYHIGNFETNTRKIISNIERAKSEGADIVVFSELSVCGYPPFDLLERKDFVDKCIASIKVISKSCNGIAAIVGGPSINTNAKGKSLYNSAYFLHEGEIKSIHNKTLLPNYDIFDESRYFEPNTKFSLIQYKGKNISISICEDIWEQQDNNNSFIKDELYTISPLEEIIKLQPDLMINIAASPFSHDQSKIRKKILSTCAKKHNLPIVYVNQVGAHTDLIFDGDSCFINSEGNTHSRLSIFKEDFKIIESQDTESASTINSKDVYMENIHDALILGIKDYFGKMGFTKATLGLSGGIDSAVTLALAVRALGKENLRVLLLPSKFSSDHSVKDAVDLAKTLGVEYQIVEIEGIFEKYQEALSPIFGDLPFNVTEENLQARIRGGLMMALSNKFGNILLNTSNKSETAVGYGTLYGDMNGGLSVLGDVYKTDVFKLAYYINKDREIIPINTIVKPPSAELRPDQKDSDSLPDYETLDSILHLYIEENKSKQEIVDLAYDESIVNRIIKLVNMNEYKRFQTSPILRISSKAFGYGRKIPLVAKY